MEKKERQITNKQLVKLYLKPIQVKSVDDIKSIHHFLFHLIYTWAGEFRKVDITKGEINFLPVSRLDSASYYLEDKSNYDLYMQGLIEGDLDKLDELLNKVTIELD